MDGFLGALVRRNFLADDQLLRAAGVSLVVALLSATLATAFGTLAGYALARFGAFPGRALLTAAMRLP